MHRRPLLDLLARYAADHPEEHALTARFVAFVEAHVDCFERSLQVGHLTGASWLLAPDGDRVLLTHHRKLDRWLQLGGHADGDTDIRAVALREAYEESGLPDIEFVVPTIFDLDIHTIPARRDEPAHEHYDVRFAMRAVGSDAYRVSEESHDLAWVPVNRLADYTDESSMLRMARKWQVHRDAPTGLRPASGNVRKP